MENENMRKVSVASFLYYTCTLLLRHSIVPILKQINISKEEKYLYIYNSILKKGRGDHEKYISFYILKFYFYKFSNDSKLFFQELHNPLVLKLKILNTFIICKY